MKNFALVQEHFRKLRCAHCQASFAPEGVKLLREEVDYWVVKVTCMACHQAAGVAIVGVDQRAAERAAERAVERPEPALAASSHPSTRARGIFSSRREEEKFAGLPPISSDELINAHAFIQNLGSDWMRHLPRKQDAT